jgi:transposase
LVRAVLESGALSGWLCGGLVEGGLPTVCVDARAAHGALKQRRSKTDRGDAEGLARLAQTGWFKIVRVKSRASLERDALLAARERLVRIQRDLMNQVRGLVKPLGLVLPRTTPRRLEARGVAGRGVGAASRHHGAPDRALAGGRRAGAAGPAAGAPGRRRLTTIPGVGVITAACFVSVVYDPLRFARADQIAAYLGLTHRRWQPGEVDRNGGISKAGNGMDRHLAARPGQAALRIRSAGCPSRVMPSSKERTGGLGRGRPGIVAIGG